MRSVLAAKSADTNNCPIPFRVFWGLQDDVVPEVSARGSFVEASPLSGGHKQLIRRGPDDPDDTRYQALKDALPDPVGHPSIYEIDLFAVNLAVSPASPQTTFPLSGDAKPFTIQTDNVAVRNVQIVFSKQNRCSIPYDQAYRRSCLSPTAVVERAGGKATGRQPDLVMQPFRPRLELG